VEVEREKGWVKKTSSTHTADDVDVIRIEKEESPGRRRMGRRSEKEE